MSLRCVVLKEPLESLGDSITTAEVVSWSKKPGDAVAEGDVVAIVDTAKVCYYSIFKIIIVTNNVF